MTRAALWALVTWGLGGISPAQETTTEREAIKKVYESVRPSMVAAEIHLKRKNRFEKAEIEQETLDPELQAIYQLAENRQTFDTWAIALDKEGLLVTADRGLKPADIEKITVTDSTGRACPGVVESVARNFDALFLKASGTFVPAAFSSFEKFKLGEYYYCTTLERADQTWHLNVSPYIVTSAPLAERKDWLLIDVMRRGAAVSDRAGALVGIAFDQYLWVGTDGRSSFVGKSVAADERVPLAALEEKYAASRKSLADQIARVEILFRADKQADPFASAEEGAGMKAALFGVPADDHGSIFVPQELARDQVRRIEEIRAALGGRSYACSFVGSFKEFGGLLLRAEGLTSRAALVADAKAPAPGALFFTVTPEERFGRTRLRIDRNRIFRTEKGLNGAARLQLRTPVPAGAFLLDFDGRLIGCAAADRKEEDVEEAALEASRDRYTFERRGYRPEYLKHLLFGGELKEILANPSPHFDPKAVPMTKGEEKKTVWLGIEYQELTKPLAEMLGVQDRDVTDDGKRGLLVTDIYPGSPAEKLGLTPGDILLTVAADGESKGIDLVPEADRFGFRRGLYGNPMGPPPWKSSRNYLTSVLTEIGAKKKVRFALVRDKVRKDVSTTLEDAPTDYETAERYKDDELGLTVKDLTYEVRYFQKVDAAASGVVAAKIESGGKAEIAKLQIYSLITRVNKSPVANAADFRRLIADFKAGSSRSLTLTTLYCGQTKLVEIARD